jgi:hypothetical protein
MASFSLQGISGSSRDTIEVLEVWLCMDEWKKVECRLIQLGFPLFYILHCMGSIIFRGCGVTSPFAGFHPRTPQIEEPYRHAPLPERQLRNFLPHSRSARNTNGKETTSRLLEELSQWF